MNSAAALHEIFSRWGENKARDDRSQLDRRALNTEEGREESLYAVELVRQCRSWIDWLNGRVAVDRFERSYKVWVQIVLGLQASWGDKVHGPNLVPLHDLDNLEGLAQLIGVYEQHVPEAALAEMRRRLGAVRALLDEDDTVDAEVAEYLASLLDEFEAALDDSPTAADVKPRADRLRMTLYAAEATSETKKGFWAKVRDDLGTPLLVDMLGQLGGAGIRAMGVLPPG